MKGKKIIENVSYADLGDGYVSVHTSKFIKLQTMICAFYFVCFSKIKQTMEARRQCNSKSLEYFNLDFYVQ